MKRKLLKPLCYILVVLFIIIINFSINRQSSRSHKIQPFNESDLIEAALLNIPICTPNDRVRQRALLITLQTWNHLALKFHIQYWIAYGTLVGYVQ
jgi:hypothetical protein